MPHSWCSCPPFVRVETSSWENGYISLSDFPWPDIFLSRSCCMANMRESASPLSLLFSLFQRLLENLTAMVQMQNVAAHFFNVMKSMSLQIFQWWFFSIRGCGGWVNGFVLSRCACVCFSGWQTEKLLLFETGVPAVAELTVLWFRPRW